MRTTWAAALLLVSACSGDAKVPRAITLGQPAPVYTALSLRGDRVATSALKGRVVLLNVWATWCAPCRDEIPFLQQLHQTKAKDGLELVGVSIDSQGEDEKVSEFARDIGMTYTIWRDPDQRILSEYMAIGVPASYLIDRQGVLRWKHVGIVRATDAVFLASLDSALAATP